MTKGMAAKLVYTTKKCNYNSIVIVHQHGGYVTIPESNFNKRYCRLILSICKICENINVEQE